MNYAVKPAVLKAKYLRRLVTNFPKFGLFFLNYGVKPGGVKGTFVRQDA
jgi:hypothetical protein